MTPGLRKFGCAAAPILAVTLAAFVIHKVSYSKRTLLEFHERGGVTIKVWAEPYRWVDEASILWSVSRNGQVIVKHGFLEPHLNPLWPGCHAVRSEDGTVIGIVDAHRPDAILAVCDLTSGFVWDAGRDPGRDREKANPFVSKLQQLQKPDTRWPLHLAP